VLPGHVVDALRRAYAFLRRTENRLQMVGERQTHRLPLDNAEAGLPAAKQIIGNFISEVEVDHGAIHVRFGNRSNQVIAGKWLSLRPGMVAGAAQVPISWLCGIARPVDGLTYAGADRTDLGPEILLIECRL